MLIMKQNKAQQKFVTIILLFICIFSLSYASSRCDPEEPCSLCMFHPRDCLGCISGYYLLGNECIECEFPCTECDIPIGQTQPKCQNCNSMESGYYLSNGECIACVYPCLTCQRADYCESCGWEPEKRNPHPNCDCKTGFWELIDEKQCKGCVYPCIACISPSMCTDCDNPNTGLYLGADFTCKPCNYPCLTCWSDTLCMTCGYDVEKRNHEDPYCGCLPGWWDDDSECRECVRPCIECLSETFCTNCDNENTGLYLLADEGKCTRCFYPCEKCWGPGNCITCGWDFELRDNSNNKCECMLGYYECGTKCEPCTPPCKKCTSATNCVDCDSLTSGKFYDEPTKNCRLCVYPCINCNLIDECITCGFGVDRRTPPECDCDDGYYEDGQVCLECIHPCIKCDSAVKCLDCNSHSSGYWLDGHVCRDCPYPCVNCLNPNHCLTCGWDIEDRIINTLCPCKVEWTEVDEACLPCKTPCVECINYVTKCTKCIDGYYLVGHRCIQCEFPCIKCISATMCLECGWKPEKRVALSGGRSECMCLTGYYPVDYDCLPCILPCLTCTAEMTCLTWDCQNETSGLYLDTTIDLCVPCIYPCNTCHSKYSCITCGWDIENREGPGLDCRCKDGYFERPDLKKCVTCQHPCVTCTDEFTCNIFNEECNTMLTGLFWKVDTCVPCVYPCDACENETYCLRCANDKENRDLPNCGCKTGFYHSSDNLCQPCVPPCVTCNSESECVSFDCDNDNSGLYLSSGACIVCPYPCDTCNDNSGTCRTCGYELEKRNNPASCTCQHGYYEYNGRQCMDCQPPCTRCHNAQQCIGSYIDCDNHNTGLYPKVDAGYYICVPCVYPCKTCRDASYCYSCVQDSPIRSTPYCGCNNGYYHYNGEICLPCQKPCIRCSSATQCITLDCIYTETGLYKTGYECEACQYPCKFCSGGPTNCYECGYMGDRRVVPRHGNRRCDCLSGYYELNQECLPCQAPCTACTDKNTCTSIDCQNSVTGLYSTRVGGLLVCRECQYPCATCENSYPTRCMTCGYGAANRFTPPSASKTCNCLYGFYELGQECLPCADPCTRCSGDATNCIGNYIVCNESAGLYSSGGRCHNCQYPCITCVTSATNCKTCGYGPEKRNSHPGCSCRTGYYHISSAETCEKCQLPCTQCTAAMTCTAISCNQAAGKYTSGLSCIDCPYPCATCYGASNKCYTCGYGTDRRHVPKTVTYQVKESYRDWRGRRRYRWATRYREERWCQCLDGYYHTGSECIPCKLPCINCTSETACSSIFCDTAKGVYQSGMTCVPCNHPCKTCSGSPTNCNGSKCGFPPERRDVSRNCACSHGYYPYLDDCLPCKIPCTRCNTATDCTAIFCDPTMGVYPAPDGKSCLKCNHPCQTCTSATNCLSCVDGGITRFTPTCGCKNDHYLKDDVCYKCKLPCLSCNNETSCIDYYDCDKAISGLYFDGSSCTKCQYPCKTCNSATDCLSCGFDVDNRENASLNCRCKSGRYDHDQLCKPCVLPCLTCDSLTNCITKYECDYENSGLYLSGSECVPCEYPCATCRTQTDCLSCGWDVVNRNGPDHALECQCKDRYYQQGKSCKPCILPCIKCTSESVCTQYYDCNKATSGLYPDGHSCKQCVYPCKTCNSPTHCYSCGYDSVNRNSAPGCGCKSGYYEFEQLCYKCVYPCLTCSDKDTCTSWYDCNYDTSGMFKPHGVNGCSLCTYPCLTCNSSSGNCRTCNYDVENRRAVNAHLECQCKAGFYDKNERCVECVLPCINCTAEDNCTSQYSCDTAISTTYKVSQANGYCKPCEYPCRTCTSNPTNCLSCGYDFENRKSTAYNCACKDGYYERDQLCYKCIYPCNRCTSEVNCIDHSYYNCEETISGTYYSGGNCIPCNYPCLTCHHGSSCRTCGYEPEKRNSASHQCSCKEGYYHHNGNECVICKLPCTKCTSETACTRTTRQRHTHTTWYGSRRYTDSHTYDRIPNQCGDTGVNGWWKEYTFRNTVDWINYDQIKCHKCKYPCITCINDHTCITCQWDMENRSNNPTCGCIHGYFEENKQCKKCVRPCERCTSVTHCTRHFACDNTSTGLYHDGSQCQPCIFPCKTCNSPTACIACGYQPDRRMGPTDNCRCKDTFYAFGEQCLPCISPCLTCSSATTCITIDCDYANTGLYNDGGVCKPCQYPCKTCMTSPNHCYSCVNDVDNRITPDAINRTCDCKPGYFHDGENLSCVKCIYPCLTCTSVTQCTAQSCLEATSGSYWDSVEQKCKECEFPCLTCETTATNCKSCSHSDISLRKTFPSCGCKDGYYHYVLQRENRCLLCPLPCKTCQNTKSGDGEDILNCLTLDCSNAVTGQYYNGSVCLDCPYPCETCTDHTAECITCGYQTVGRKEDSSCGCKLGYVEDLTNQICVKMGCSAPCVECRIFGGVPVPTMCTICPEGQYSNGAVCLPCNGCTKCDESGRCLNCPPDKYLKDGSCQTCEPPCLNCLDANTCIDCLVDDTNFQNGPPSCTCRHGYSRIGISCLTCTLPCLECADDVASCTKCIITYYKEDPMSAISNCLECPTQCHECTNPTTCQSCSEGFYLSGTSCLACEYPCVTCTSATYCNSCASVGDRLPLPSCGCIPPLHDNGAQCITCTEPCLACAAEHDQACRSCIKGYYLIPGTECLTQPCPTDPALAPPKCEVCPEGNAVCESATVALECLDGYYLDGETCHKCVTPCETCLSATFCLSCGFDDGEAPLRINPPTCQCQEGYSDFGTHCSLCTAPCKTCNSLADDDCISCIDPYYLDGTQCLDCDISCGSCTGPADTECTSCASGYYSSGGLCPACVYPCATCYTEFECATCSNDASIRFVPPSCMCHHDKYDNGANCLDCPHPCKSCSLATTTDCLSCLDGYWLDGTECPACDQGCVTCLTSGSDCESCKDGWYLVGNECRKCSPLCKTCYDEHMCIECGVEPAKQIGPPTCYCPHGLSPWVDGELCITCTEPCLTCTGPLTTNCETCIDPYYLVGTECIECYEGCASCDGEADNCQSCKDGWWLDGSTCVACISPCARCLSPTHCLECGYGEQLRENYPECKCKPLFYDNTDECLACVSPCKECTTAADCTVCVPKHYLDGTSCLPCATGCYHCTGDADYCEDCDDGYYLDTVNMKCIACNYPCINCYDADKCLTCGFDAHKRTVPPLCQCKHGTSDNGTTCVVCTDPCATCNTVADDDCLSCIEGYYLVGATTTCEICDPGCATCKNTSDECYRCNDGYYLQGTTCVQCSHPCATCYSDTECYTCVEDLEVRRVAPPTCQCRPGFSDDQTICVECIDPCYTCNTASSTDCITCNDKFYLVGTECLPCGVGCSLCEGDADTCQKCLDGYYLDGTSCVECVSPCTKCLTATFCLQCGFGDENRLTPPTCQCKYGFKDLTTHCEACPEGYASCSSGGSADVECADEFFDDGGTCQPCNTGCLKCDGTFDNCTKCIDQYYLFGNECKSCEYPCRNCLSPTQCLSCGYDNYNRILPPTCGCKQGMSDNGSMCITCTSPCKTCNSASATDCITCIDGTFLSGTSCLGCGTGCTLCVDNADKCSKCEEGFYLEGTQCKPCVSPCIKCVSATLCLECGYGIENRLSFPQCTCKKGFSDIGTSCVACTDPCMECNSSSATDCRKCHKGRFLEGTECKLCATGCIECVDRADKCSSCENGYYLDPLDEKCKQCQSPCVLCASLDFCLTCDDNDVDRLPAPTCKCINGKSSIGNSCQTTPTPCLDSTTLVNDSCLECIDEYYLTGSTCTPCNEGCRTCNGDPATCVHCMTGYFKEADGTTCSKCKYPCLTCDTREDYCLYCATFPTIVPGVNGNRLPPPTCACELGYGEGWAALGCIICNPPCLLCNSYATDDCVACVDNYYLAVGTTECRPCKPGCKTCLESDINYCPDKCLPGYYFDSDNTTCHKCPSPCATCFTADYCITCGYGASKRIWQPSCICEFGLSDNGEDCLTCQSPCKTCFEEQPDKCWSCVDTYYLDGEQCLSCPLGCKTCEGNPGNCSDCIDGYWYDSVNEACVICKTPCATCLSDTECLTCGYGEDSRILPPTCACIDGESDRLDQCVICTSPCVKCYSEASDDCITCIAEHYIDGRQCKPCGTGCLYCETEPNNCQACLDGYYHDGESSCIQCVTPCATCLSATHCYSCGFGEENRINPPTCGCVDGESDRGDQCVICISPCRDCTSDDTNSCTTCIDDYYLVGTTCQTCKTGCKKCGPDDANVCQECNDGFYLHTDGEGVSTCNPCKSPCITCMSDTFCYTCGYGESLRIQPPTCACFEGYSDNTSQCVVCDSPCLTCSDTGTSNCLTCVDEFYISGSLCLPCKNGCLECDINDNTICSRCKDGFYMEQDGENFTCEPCQTPCITCLTRTFCYTCGYDPEGRRIQAPTCACTEEFSDSGAGCITCNSPCKTCGATADTCTGCVLEWYFDTNDNSCKNCPVGCDLCLDPDMCKTCLDGYQHIMDGEAERCIPCKYPCKTCLNDTYCYSCVDLSLSDRVIPPTCACIYPLSDGGQAYGCLLCLDPCETCRTTSPYDCITCIDKWFLNDDNTTCQECKERCATCTALDQCQTCIEGSYLDGEDCKPCIYPCATCLNPVYCYTCGYDVANKNGPPLCDCKTDYSAGSTKCLECIPPCERCTGLAVDKCVTCITGYYIDDTTCIKCPEACSDCVNPSICFACSPGWYIDGESCIPCNPPCKSCWNDKDCYECISLDNRNIGPICNCLDGYHDLGTECALCPSPEKICNVPSDYINCVDGWYYELQYDRNWVLDPPKEVEYQDCNPPTSTDHTIPDGESAPFVDGETVEVDGEFTTTTVITTSGTIQTVVVTVCETKTRTEQPPEDGEWVDVPKNTCQPCQYPCKNCYSSTYCYECVDGEYRDYAPLCECDIGYYDDGSECLQCPHPAATCTDPTTFYSCKDGWFLQYNDCIECLYPCITCVRQYVCLTCGWDVGNRHGTPDCNCIDTLYNDGESQSCKLCPLPSHTCLSPTEFTSCKDEWFLRDSNCLACVYPCKTCESETYCLTCGYDVANKEPNQTCACRYGDYYQDGEFDGERCSICVSPCDKCISRTECLSCRPGWTLEGYHCRPCNYPCVTCLGDFCLDCGMDVENSNTPDCACILQVGDSGTYQECYEEGCPIYACIPPCKNCKSETECTECLDPYNRKDVPDCNCKDGYELNLNDQCVLPCTTPGTYGTVDGECLPCVDPCSECNGDPDKCTDCIFGFKLYDNNECRMVCVYPCKTCTTSTECITCDGLYRDDTRNCECADGYYEEGDQCLICQSPCKWCSDVNTCTKCIEDDGESADGENAWNREDESLNCACKTDFSPFEGKCIPKCEDGWFNYQMGCLKCNPNCHTCFGQGSACTSCADQYWYDGTTCLPCDKNCKQCTQGDGECSECDPDAVGREQVLPYCKCQSGYFERGTTDCGVCVSPCVTCEGTRNHCLECVEGGLNRNDAPDCNCKDGFFLKDDTCKECSYKCDTCNILADGCLTCHQDAVGRHKGIGDPNPECKCLDGYFDAGEKDCHECVYPCAKCVGTDTYCLECVNPLQDRKDAPDCNCSDGNYGDPSGNCQTCGNLCSTCVTDADNCIECDGENRTAPECKCKENYYSVTVDSVCIQCNSPCWNCETTADYCKDCISGPFRLPAPHCTCEPGYFENDAFACLKCSHPCHECEGTATGCKSCALDSDPNRYDITQDCKCHEGYYSNGRSCAACHEGCEECEFEATNCTKFKDGFSVGGGKCAPQCKLCSGTVDNCIVCALGYGRVMMPPLCDCAEGMYAVDDDLSCKDCPQQCNTCKNGNTCISCKNPMFMPPLCRSAIQGNFLALDLEGGLIVGNCDAKCEACTESQNLCSVCSKGRHRRQLPPHCECEYGFHDNYGSDYHCSPCPKECKSCNSFNECTECKENLNRELEIFQGGCSCIKGYKQFEDNLRCEKCYQYQNECVLFCPDNTVQDEQNSICVEKNMNMLDNVKLIQVMAVFVLASLIIVSLTFMSSLQKSLKRLRRFFLLRDRKRQHKTHMEKLKGSSSSSSDEGDKKSNVSMMEKQDLLNNDNDTSHNGDFSPLQSRNRMDSINDDSNNGQTPVQSAKRRLRSRNVGQIMSNFLNNHIIGANDDDNDSNNSGKQSSV